LNTILLGTLLFFLNKTEMERKKEKGEERDMNKQNSDNS
tara:strand:- start:44 stop:160 length:117 start_codon:yes stop_codon:yes gene_type:complete